MLSQSTINDINRRISTLLRENARFITSDEDRATNLKEIESLSAVLNPQPSKDEIIREIAAALQKSIDEPTPKLSALDELVGRLMKYGR